MQANALNAPKRTLGYASAFSRCNGPSEALGAPGCVGLKEMVEHWINRITYKKGWWLKLSESPATNTILMHVGYKGPSSSGDPEREIAHSRCIEWPTTFEQFVREAITTFQELENHETREWFLVDGKHWPDFLPHDPNAIMVPLRNTGARYDAFQQEKKSET